MGGKRVATLASVTFRRSNADTYAFRAFRGSLGKSRPWAIPEERSEPLCNFCLHEIVTL